MIEYAKGTFFSILSSAKSRPNSAVTGFLQDRIIAPVVFRSSLCQLITIAIGIPMNRIKLEMGSLVSEKIENWTSTTRLEIAWLREYIGGFINTNQIL